MRCSPTPRGSASTLRATRSFAPSRSAPCGPMARCRRTTSSGSAEPARVRHRIALSIQRTAMNAPKTLRELSCADDYDPNSMPVETARTLIRQYLEPVTATERLHVRAALGRVLAEDV